MKQSDPIDLVKNGSLPRPGPVGRFVRLTLGLACLYAVYQLILHRPDIVSQPVAVLPNIAVLVLVAMCIFNYVVNIGFGKSWKRTPVIVTFAALGLLGAISALVFKTLDHPLLGWALWAWLFYFYVHLGVSFLLSAIIATPGCEMRAIPDLFGRLRGRHAPEHHCPAAFITKIDAWERKRSESL